MKKNIFFAAVALVALVNCTSDERIGGEAISPDSPQGGQGVIVFSTDSKGITRAGSTGADAAEVLNKNFVVFGTKTSSGGTQTTQTVFDNYQANYVTGSEHTTTSNSAGWEYVGYTNVPNGVTTNVGVTAYANNTTANTSGIEQTIKYWDYSARQYDFFAYSLGKGVTSGSNTTYAKASALRKDDTNGYTYTLSGTTAELSACYISDLLKKTDMNATNTQVSLQFQQLVSKLRIGLYEIIPGYSVKDVKFYPSAENNATSDYTAYLYVTGESLLPPQGTFTVTFDDTNGKPQVALATSSGGSGSETVKNVSFGKAQSKDTENKWSHWASKEYREVADADTLFLGRTSSACTISETQSVLPNPNGSKLNLKVDYTLVSRDGNGETIQVTGATATVPAEYAKWQPGYSYTYLFKISDNTNGTTGQVLGLSPITLDAVVNTGADGKQETITTVTNTSITTYQKGSEYATTNEYKDGTIYVVVFNGTAVQALTVGDGGNAKLYTANVTLDPGKEANITEASVANAIANPTGAKDANDNPMSITSVATDATDKLAAITTIPADDAPHGEAVNINGASFTAEAGKTYVFEYTYTENSETKKAYKVIKVAAGS